jgi:hypothetical protein
MLSPGRTLLHNKIKDWSVNMEQRIIKNEKESLIIKSGKGSLLGVTRVTIIGNTTQEMTQKLNLFFAQNYGLIESNTNAQITIALLGSGNTMENRNRVEEMRAEINEILPKINIKATSVKVEAV